MIVRSPFTWKGISETFWSDNSDPVNPAFGVKDYRLRIRQPSHGGIDAMNGPSLLHVPFQLVVEFMDLARLNVLHEQAGLGTFPPDERESFSVR